MSVQTPRVATNANRPTRGSIHVPTLGQEMRFEDWYWKELREGGLLHRYVRTEKFQTRARLRTVARVMDRRMGAKQDTKSDFRLKAAVPARDFFRWQAEDPHFWADDKNLRSFKRDNPDACIYVD